jgi:CcmD family protein
VRHLRLLVRVSLFDLKRRVFDRSEGRNPLILNIAEDSVGPIQPALAFWGLQEKNYSVNSSLAFLASVNVVIWVGLFFYLWRIDRRIAEKERER